MAMRDDELISWFGRAGPNQELFLCGGALRQAFRASSSEEASPRTLWQPRIHQALPRSIVSEHGRQSTQWFGDGPSTAGRLGRGRADGPRD